jgi:hypothetical protein
MAVAKKKAPTTKAAQLNAEQAHQVVEKVRQVRTPDVLKDLTDLQIAIAQQVSGISAKVQSALTQHEEVNTAVTVQQERLKELFDIEGEALSLDEFRVQCDAARTAWREEEAQHADQIAQRDKDLAVARQREQREYDYQRDQKRRAEEDAYGQQREAIRRQFAQQDEERDRVFKEREAALTAREARCAEIEKQLAEVPAKYEAEKTSAMKAQAGAMAKDHGHAMELLNARHAADMQVRDSTIKQQQVLIDGHGKTIAELQNQLKDANVKITEVANKALESQSGRQALETLQRDRETAGTVAPQTPRR